LFDSLSDDYFQQRKTDLSDVLARIYRNLERKRNKKEDSDKPTVLVAHELLPSEVALNISRKKIIGMALDMGGQTSHTAILARSLGIPAVVGLHDISLRVKSGDYIIVDGTDGEVIVNPTPAVRREFQSKKERYEVYQRELKKIAKLKPETLDGVRFKPLANIELPEEVETAFSYGAEGIGLFRSEFIYLQRPTLPSEEDHLPSTRRWPKALIPDRSTSGPLISAERKACPSSTLKRTQPGPGPEGHPLFPENRELFRTQIRAILRASCQKERPLDGAYDHRGGRGRRAQVPDRRAQS